VLCYTVRLLGKSALLSRVHYLVVKHVREIDFKREKNKLLIREIDFKGEKNKLLIRKINLR